MRNFSFGYLASGSTQSPKRNNIKYISGAAISRPPKFFSGKPSRIKAGCDVLPSGKIASLKIFSLIDFVSLAFKKMMG